jgi:hypothetical protein
MKRYFFKVPAHVAMIEAAALFDLMALGECDRSEFLDQRHHTLYGCLVHLQRQNGMTGTQELVCYLREHGLLEVAGGIAYVQKVFGCLEPAEVYQ